MATGESGVHGVNAVGHAEEETNQGCVNATTPHPPMEGKIVKDHSDKENYFVTTITVQVMKMYMIILY